VLGRGQAAVFSRPVHYEVYMFRQKRGKTKEDK
jgi:hypothetical protein